MLTDEEKRHYLEVGLRAAKRAARKVAVKAQQENREIPIWRDGRVVYEVPVPSEADNV